jgi:hypothetical protein
MNILGIAIMLLGKVDTIDKLYFMVVGLTSRDHTQYRRRLAKTKRDELERIYYSSARARLTTRAKTFVRARLVSSLVGSSSVRPRLDELPRHAKF